MYFGWDTNHELPTIVLFSQRLGCFFTGFFHIFNDIRNKITDALQSGLRLLGEPAEAWEFSTKTDVFLIVFLPGYPVGISIISERHDISPTYLLPSAPELPGMPWLYLCCFGFSINIDTACQTVEYCYAKKNDLSFKKSTFNCTQPCQVSRN